MHLGSAAQLSESTIRDFEKGRRIPSVNNLAAIRGVLEAAGVTFLADCQAAVGDGVSLRRD
jgi:transcriptional regulator with XRE-family HTH domain